VNLNNTRIFGCSAFGLDDAIVSPEDSFHLGFYLADALLPTSSLDSILTGDQAESERLNSGLPWPPEARVDRTRCLRRVPIACAWRALVESGDSSIRWSVDGGISFPLPRILATHVTDLLTAGGLRTDGNDMAVVAIPNDLDEYGQDGLLKELNHKGLNNVQLIWRPIAAALAWLDEVGEEFPNKLGDDDHLHVLYLGSDAIEAATFRLRIKPHNNGLFYVLPRRDRPESDLPLTGFDWAGRIIQDNFSDLDDCAFWRAFTCFPEIWEALADREWNSKELPRVWSRGREWTLWNPDKERVRASIKSTSCKISSQLRGILGRSIRLAGHTKLDLSNGSWIDALSAELNRFAKCLPEGRLRGMIVCGPLASRFLLSTVRPALDHLLRRGLNLPDDLAIPSVNGLWLPPANIDPVARGAAVYGRRLLEKKPTYLDTLPPLSILAHHQGHNKWVPLVNDVEWPGGEDYEKEINGQFKLKGGQHGLDVFLCKSKKNTNDEMEIDDAQCNGKLGITYCRLKLLRKVVLNLGSIEKVKNRFPGKSVNDHYAKDYAEELFSEESEVELSGRNSHEKNEVPLSECPFRKALFSFPAAPEHDVVLDAKVRMRPASGLAQVELLPKNKDFLQGRKVFLDYSTMRAVDQLPRQSRGWPPIEEILTDPEDILLNQGKMDIALFESSSPSSENYLQQLNNIYALLKKSSIVRDFGEDLRVQLLDAEGRVCTQEGQCLLNRLSKKFLTDFNETYRQRRTALFYKIIIRASWLHAATPQGISEYLARAFLGNDATMLEWNGQHYNWMSEAASRCLTRTDDIVGLFNRICRHTDDGTALSIQFVRSIGRVLRYRRCGQDALDKRLIKLISDRSMRLLKQFSRGQLFEQKFYQIIQLHLYLLRYRKVNQAYLAPGEASTEIYFNNIKECLQSAHLKLKQSNRLVQAERVQRIINGFKRYMDYQGSASLLVDLNEAADEV